MILSISLFRSPFSNDNVQIALAVDRPLGLLTTLFITGSWILGRIVTLRIEVSALRHDAIVPKEETSRNNLVMADY